MLKQFVYQSIVECVLVNGLDNGLDFYRVQQMVVMVVEHSFYSCVPMSYCTINTRIDVTIVVSPLVLAVAP